MKHYTYIHQTADTGKIFYVGKGSRKDRAFSLKNRNKYWRNIVKKHGYSVEILAYWGTEEEAFSHEKLLISSFRDMGYKLTNMTNGGEGVAGLVPSKEHRDKLSLSMKNSEKAIAHRVKFKFNRLGSKHTEQAKKEMSIKATGRKMNPDAIEKANLHRIGKKHSEEHKKNISLGLIHSRCNERKIICKDNGLIFCCSAEAKRYAQNNGFPNAKGDKIVLVCKGERKVAYGLTWSFI